MSIEENVSVEGIVEGDIDERFCLVRDRIKEIPDELLDVREEKYSYLDFFVVKSRYINMMLDIYDDPQSSDYLNKEMNYKMYEDIIGDNYATSYSNPDYADKKLGAMGGLFSFISAELAELPGLVFDNKKPETLFLLETFLELYFMFKNGDDVTISSVEDVIRSYATDYAQLHTCSRLYDIYSWS